MKYDFDRVIPRERTNCVKYDLRKEFFGREDVIPMWVADMDFAVPDFITDSLIERAHHPIYGYSVLSESYYQSIINWMKKKHDWKIIKDWIVYSPGIVTALNLLVETFTEPGEAVIIQPPVYFPFFWAVEKTGRKLLYNQLVYENGRYVINFDDLEKKMRQGAKMVILCSPHNPVGRVWNREELEKLAALSLQYRVVVVSDEIHNDLVFKPHKHIPMATLSEETAMNTITCIAPSKTFNLAGMATSSIIISNPEWLKKFKKTIDRIHLNTNIFGSVASEAAYTHGEEWLEQLMVYLQGNIDFIKEHLISTIPKIRIIDPQATYLMWLDFNQFKIQNSKLKIHLVDLGLGLNDGRQFGPGGRGFFRMNFGCPRGTIEEALGKLANL